MKKVNLSKMPSVAVQVRLYNHWLMFDFLGQTSEWADVHLWSYKHVHEERLAMKHLR